MSPSRNSDPIRRQAIDWLVRRQSGAFSKAEREQFEHWLADSECRRIYEQVAAIWGELPYPAHEMRAARQAKRRLPFPVLSSLAFAASLLVAVGLGWREGWPMVDERVWRTGKGELSRIVLADGSTVELNTNSELVAHYGWRSRTLELRRGEALFSVAPLKWRPFQVLAGGALLRDIGTRFNVVLTDKDSRIAVLEGAIDLAIVSTGERRRTDAGQSLTYNPATVLSEPAAIDVEAAVAWREHKMIFRNTPLTEALRELERYQPVHFRIPDPAVARMRIGGAFLNDDLDAFLNTLQWVLPVEIKRGKNNEVLVERRRS